MAACGGVPDVDARALYHQILDATGETDPEAGVTLNDGVSYVNAKAVPTLNGGNRRLPTKFVPAPATSVEVVKGILRSGRVLGFVMALTEAVTDFFNEPPNKHLVMRTVPTTAAAQGGLEGHAMTIIGYSDKVAGGCFLVRSSWGRWGWCGNFFMPYRYLGSDLVEQLHTSQGNAVGWVDSSQVMQGGAPWFVASGAAAAIAFALL